MKSQEKSHGEIITLSKDVPRTQIAKAKDKVFEVKQLNKDICKDVEEVELKIENIQTKLKSQVIDYEEGTRVHLFETYRNCFGRINYKMLKQVMHEDL